MNRRTATVRNNAIGSILVKGWGVIVSLILVPMTMDYLSPEVYGVWLTLSSIVLCLTFFDIGFTNGLKNKLAEALAAGDTVRGKALVSTAYALMLAIFLPLGLLLEIAVPFVDWCRLLNVAPSLAPQLVAAMRILLFCFALQMIFNTITAVLAACQRTAVSSVFPVVANTLSVLIIYILTRTTPPSLVALAQAIAYLPAIVLLFASLILFRTRYRALAPSPACVDRTAVAALFSLGLKFFLLQIHYVVMYQATNIIISNLSSPQQVTVYNVAYKYLSVGMLAVAIIMNPLWPAFTDAYAKGDYPWMRRTYRAMRRLVGAVMAT
ncbi:MAG: MATE family efflux transporter, partial [Muribaculaceae bacterium]|nr:MATE family efflux transporter [Muribaculaceae bacterium]